MPDNPPTVPAVRRVPTMRAALDALAADAPDAAAVAAKLRDAGMTGKPGAGMDCPVAHWLREATGETIVVTHIDASYTATSDEKRWFTEDDDLTLPDSISAFVLAFDNDEYPDLKTDVNDR